MRHTTRGYLGLIFAILVGVLLRFHRIGEMPLRADEALTLFFASDLTTIFHEVTTSDPHLPTFYFMLHGWLAIAGTSELAERFPSLFASVLVIPLTYTLGRIVNPLRPRVALFGAILIVVNPYLIWDAQDAHINAFLTALSLGSFVLFLRALHPDANLFAWLKFVLASLFNLLFHYFAALILVAQGALLLVLVLQRRVPFRQMVHALGAAIAIAVLYTPWLVLALPVLASYGNDFLLKANVLEMASRTLVALTVGRGDSRLMPPMIDPLIGNLLALVFLALFLVGLFVRTGMPAGTGGSRSQQNDQTRRIATSDSPASGNLVPVTYLGIPLAIIFTFSLWRFPIFDERYVLFLAPAFSLIVALGLNALYEIQKAKGLAVAGLAYIVCASGYSLFNYWYVPAYAKSPDWHSFVDHIAAEAQPSDVLIQNYPDPALPYYLKDRIPRILLPRSSGQSEADLNADLARITGRYNRLWFQPAPNSTWDTDGKVATWLERHAREIRAYDVRGARLELYATADAAVRNAKPVNATFGGHIRLIAFDLEQTKRLTLRLYWQTDAKLASDYTVFVHLYSSEGRLVAQKDSTPVNGTFPTSQWEANGTIVDTYEVTLPGELPSGTYTVMAGMYDSQTQVRLPVVDGEGKAFPENRVLLTTVNVLSSMQPPVHVGGTSTSAWLKVNFATKSPDSNVEALALNANTRVSEKISHLSLPWSCEIPLFARNDGTGPFCVKVVPEDFGYFCE
jgi:mannosyltransferase